MNAAQIMVERSSPLSFYELLEVGTTATFEEIEQSYHRIATYLGPDSLALYSILDGDEAGELRARLDEAYRILSDPDRRAAYDRARLEDTGYPPVLVPAQPQDTTMSIGHQVRATTITREMLGREVTREPLYGRTAPLADRERERDRDREREWERDRDRDRDRERDRERELAPHPSSSTREPHAEAPILTKGTSDVLEVRPKPAPLRPATLASAKPKKRILTPSAQIDVGPDAEFSGALLRRLRESANATLDELAEITRVGKRYLIAIEEHDFAQLPAAVYTRGYVAEYARVLGLDAQRVAKSYMAIYNRYRQGG